MQLECIIIIIILRTDTHFYSHVPFLNEPEVVLKPPEGKRLFLELPYHPCNPQQDIFVSQLLSDRDQPQSLLLCLHTKGGKKLFFKA